MQKYVHKLKILSLKFVYMIVNYVNWSKILVSCLNHEGLLLMRKHTKNKIKN